MPVSAKQPYRESTLVNNRKNKRTDGMRGPKKVKTKAAQDEKQLCPFSFVIKWDNNGFFVTFSRRSGRATHEYHRQIFEKGALPFPTRLLTKD